MTEQAFDTILEYLRRTRGFDVSVYKRTTLKRRIDRRMQAIGTDGYELYLGHLQGHPDEFASLFNTILINVTSFFRDPDVWDTVAADFIPAILASKAPEDPVRIWSAGCASGEEAYTLAILMAEALGADGFRQRVKIYATDVDEDALAQARRAVYTPGHIEAVPAALLEKYFEHADGNYTLTKDIRRAVTFGRHDLVQDAPISRVDFLACRNTLMYFNAEAQARIAARFHFALQRGGCLLLGKAEMLFNYTTTFVAVDLKRRVFRATPQGNSRERLLLVEQGGRGEPGPTDVELAAVPIGPAAFNADAEPATITVTDVTRYRTLRNEPGRSKAALESADEELQSTNQELETTNEELHSTVEELETTNEELRSTNEELQFTNEQLQTINDELRARSNELNDANSFMRTILGSLRSAVIVVDRELLVQAWNARAEEMWGLREAEVLCSHLLDLDFGLPLEELTAGIKNSLSTSRESGALALEAVTRRGRRFTCHVACSPLVAADGAQRGAILVMEDQESREKEPAG
jgi:two-component system CheB/CheR fusion protein